MSRTYRKFKGRRKTAHKNMCWSVYIDDYPSQPNKYGHYSGAGLKCSLLRGIGNRRHALRYKDTLRRKSIPPNPWDDFWAVGRLRRGWRSKVCHIEII